MPDTAPLTATARAAAWLADLASALERRDVDAATNLLREDGYWRDIVAFTWDIVTLEGRRAIAAMLRERLADTAPSAFQLDGEATEQGDLIEAFYRFETRVGRGRGVLRLKAGPEGHRGWILLTTLQELKGHEERRGRTRDNGVVHGVVPGRETWSQRRAREAAELGRTVQPYCLVVGGGQGGIALGARLKRLGVSTLIIDQHPRPGDAWRKRYASLTLHDVVWYDHLPYIPFPDHWPVFSPKDQIADWLESYVKVMELDWWGSTRCTGAVFDEATKTWTVTAERRQEDGSLETLTLRPRQLVLATGMSGRPNRPRIPGMELFQGEQHHSADHPGGAPYKGKRCVVVGANTSAHDIAADLVEQGAASVTMVQRSSTLIVKSDTLMIGGNRLLYSEDALARGMTTDKADLMVASWPVREMAEQHKPFWREVRRQDAELYRRLEAVGFQLDFGEDESGAYMKYLRRGAGFYFDVGACELVCDGTIALKSRVGVERLTEDAVVLSDGTALPADLVVWATGYGPMHEWAAELISPEVAEKVGPCWGYGSATKYDPGPWEGEQRNMWKPTRQEALWFHGGNLAQSRHYGLYLALQIKAREAGLI